MSTRCQDIRPLLAALAYEEIDADERAAVETHLEGCTACQARFAAYGAARSDLQQWQLEATTSGIRFIAPPRLERPSLLGSAWVRGLAVAASFVFGLVLTAAAVNLRVNYDEGGFSINTRFGNVEPQSTADAARSGPDPLASMTDLEPPGGATTQPIAFERLDRQALDRWLDQALSSRDIAPVERAPIERQAAPADRLSDEQLREVRELVAARLEARLEEYGTQQSLLFSDMIAASETRQQEAFENQLAGIWTDLQTQHRDDLYMLANQLGFNQVSTDQQIRHVNQTIDYLIDQVAQSNVPPQERR